MLLHVCCGPCATAVVERLGASFDVTAFWCNPNVQPQREHDRRLTHANTVARALGVDLIVQERDEQGWLEAVAGYEAEPEGGARCDICFEWRLRATVVEAARLGIAHAATTLTISPHKPTARINDIGRRLGESSNVHFVQEDFGERDGFQRSVELSRKLSLYRQRYCGCLFAGADDD